MPELVCLGIIVVDVWGRPVADWPARGTLGLVEEIGLGIGGCAANCAVDYARLGGEVAVMGCVGQDVLGDIVLRLLTEAGVQLSVQRTDRASTSGTIVAVHPDGERTFLHATGANGHVDPARLDLDLIRATPLLALLGALVMPGFDGEPQARVLAEAQAAGVTTLVDTVYNDAGHWMQVLRPVLAHADIFVPSINEARQLTGLREPPEIAAALLAEGPGLVGIKLGPEGSYFRTAGQELWVPAYPVEVVDGNGAGDAFVAGFLWGLRRGWDLESTARFASAVGGLCTTAVGTTAGVRSYAETVCMIEAWEGRPWNPGTAEAVV